MIPLVRNDIYNKITNKQSFLDLCKEQQIKTPERYSYIPESFPFVVKPKHNITENGKSLYPHIINNSVELRYFERNENENDFFYEEFIGGKSFYLLFYISRNGHSECFSQENLIQQDKGKSIIFAVASRIHKCKISDHFITLFRKIHFHGIVMVELRSRDGHYYAIEANPRFWGPSQLIIDQQWTIFRHFIEDFTGQSSSKVQCPSSKPRYYLWLNGFIDGIINARKTAYFGLKKRILLKLLLNIMCDIYLKHDTIWLFLFELSHIIKNRIVYGNR
jgi:predicted ATP-grasp superfamily ATP-dependent carboligase